MDYTPLPVIFLLIYLDAIIFHVDEIRFGKKLVGKYRHILADLYTRTTEVVAVRMKFALDGFQKPGYRRMVVHPLGNYRIEISETAFGPEPFIAGRVPLEPFVKGRFFQSDNVFRKFAFLRRVLLLVKKASLLLS